MKKNILYFLIAFLFFAVACGEDAEVEFYELGSEFLISTSSYTSLDNAVTVTIENQQKNLSEVTIKHLGGLTTTKDVNGDKIPFTSTYTGTIGITDGDGSVTLSDAQLGMTTVGWTADFQFDAIYDGKPYVRYKTITVVSPIKVTIPEVKHRSDTAYHFKFSIKPGNATLETYSIESKKGVNDVYSSAGAFNAVDSVEIIGTDYKLTDTLYIKVVGTVGAKTATTISKVLFSPVSLKHQSVFALDSTANLAFDLINKRYVESTIAYEDSADLQLTTTIISGGYTMGFMALNNAEFVLGTPQDYINADIHDIENEEFISPVAVDNDVAVGDVYIFRTKRGALGTYHYGVMKVITVAKPQGVLDDSYIEFSFKY